MLLQHTFVRFLSHEALCTMNFVFLVMGPENFGHVAKISSAITEYGTLIVL